MHRLAVSVHQMRILGESLFQRTTKLVDDENGTPKRLTLSHNSSSCFSKLSEGSEPKVHFVLMNVECKSEIILAKCNIVCGFFKINLFKINYLKRFRFGIRRGSG